jgi:hypothetical protein
VAVGDFNADGNPDLAVTNSGSNTVSVLLGNGLGGFTVRQILTVGNTPEAVAVGDFNGDRIPDLAVANYGCGGGYYSCPPGTSPSTTVTVLLGNGDGTFQTTPSLTFNVGLGPNSIAVGDFNGDGKLDMAVANYGDTRSSPGGCCGDGTTVSVLLGTGTGAFQLLANYPVGVGASFVAVGDFNGDGKLDLAVASYHPTNTVTVLLGNGDGTFRTLSPTNPVGGGPWSIAVGDFDGDGKLDLAVATYLTDRGTISVLLGNGDGTFQPRHDYPAGWRPISVAASDVNNDGILDLAVADFRSSTVSVLLGNGGGGKGDGTFQAPQSFDAGTQPGFVAIADVNRDGLKDLLVPNTVSTAVSVLLGAGPTSQVTPTPVLNPAGGSFPLSVQVTITDSVATAAIYYTTDGSTPTLSSTRYTGPITVTKTTTIKAIAQAAGFQTSGVTSGTYTIQVAPPTFSPPGGTYGAPQSVTLTATSGATIYYTTDGSTPTTASTLYTAAISVTRSMTIKAMATASGMANSSVASATYTIQVAPPTFSLPGGTYGAPQSVTLSDATSGTTIYYTTDGSTPTTASTLYTGAISVTQSMTIKALAAASGMANSNVASATYTLQTATPTFSPPGGTYVLPQFVSISDASPGATIYYTTDGSTPTTSSAQYAGPILVVTTTTIKAMAVVPGWSQSPVASATYTNLIGL